MNTRIPLEEIWSGLEKGKDDVKSGWLMRRIGYDGADCYVIFIKEKNRTYFGVKSPDNIKELLESKYSVIYARAKADEYVLVEMKNYDIGYNILEEIHDSFSA